MRLAAATASGFGKVLRQFRRAHGGQAPPTLPLPLRSRKRANERAPASPRISERLPVPSPRRAAMKARTSAGVSLASCLSDGRAAQMLGEKSEELADVAPIGLQRLGRHAPLGAEIAEPAGDFGGDVGGGGKRRSWPACRTWHRFLHPSLSAPESARPLMACVSSMSWCRSRSTRPIPTACRTGSTLAPGDVVTVPLGARANAIGVVWADNPTSQSAPAQPAEGRRRQARRAAAQGRAAQLRRLGVGLHAGRARHGAAHGVAHGRASRARPRARRRAARRTAAAAHDRGARARARAVSPTA